MSDSGDPSYEFFYAGGTVSLGPEDAGKDVVLLPFQLGDIAKVDGANADTFTFKGTRQTQAALMELRTESPGSRESGEKMRLSTEAMGPREIDHNLRTLLNRFDPTQGQDQGDWFWGLARTLDTELQSQERFALSPTVEAAQGVEDYYRKVVSTDDVRERFHLSAGLTAEGCPRGNVYAPDVQDPGESDQPVIPPGGVVQDEDFCLVYLSDPKTESDKSKIQASIKKILNLYKTVIYRDPLAPAADGYAFKPVIVIVDFDEDAGKWPSLASYQVVGAYIRSLSEEAKQPMIYMASDVTKIKSNKGVTLDQNLVNRQWHGTLAHEMQHAIMDFYRSHKQKGVLETPAIDEGLAHYMEDLFGYGEENFGDFAKAYLDVWSETNPPVLHASESGKIERGGAWLFWYYLISQKGGVSFADGAVVGGDGLAFIRAVVQDTAQRGPANLAAKVGRDWARAVGGFFGAVVVDGSDLAVKPQEFLVQEPQAVVDLAGNAGKKYGMHFNNFGGRASRRSFADKTFRSGTNLEDVSYYATTPTHLEQATAGDVLKFESSSDAANFAVVKVRLN